MAEVPPWTAVLPVNPTSHPGLLQAAPSLPWWTPDPHPSGAATPTHLHRRPHMGSSLNLILAYNQTGWAPSCKAWPTISRRGLAPPWIEPQAPELLPRPCTHRKVPQPCGTSTLGQLVLRTWLRPWVGGVLGVLPASGRLSTLGGWQAGGRPSATAGRLLSLGREAG